MSAMGQKQTCAVQNGTSALPPKEDMCSATWDVRFGPKADIESHFGDPFRCGEPHVPSSRCRRCYAESGRNRSNPQHLYGCILRTQHTRVDRRLASSCVHFHRARPVLPPKRCCWPCDLRIRLTPKSRDCWHQLIPGKLTR